MDCFLFLFDMGLDFFFEWFVDIFIKGLGEVVRNYRNIDFLLYW